jgi:hypothetical protein
MIGLKRDDAAIVDSIIVVTHPCILHQQIRHTIKQFAQVGAAWLTVRQLFDRNAYSRPPVAAASNFVIDVQC